VLAMDGRRGSHPGATQEGCSAVRQPTEWVCGFPRKPRAADLPNPPTIKIGGPAAAAGGTCWGRREPSRLRCDFRVRPFQQGFHIGNRIGGAGSAVASHLGEVIRNQGAVVIDFP